MLLKAVKHETFRRALGNSGFVTHLLRQLKAAKLEEKLWYPCINAMCLMCQESQNNRDCICSEDGLPLILDFLGTEKVSKIHDRLISVLLHFLDDVRSMKILLQHGVVAVLIQHFQRTSGVRIENLRPELKSLLSEMANMTQRKSQKCLSHAEFKGDNKDDHQVRDVSPVTGTGGDICDTSIAHCSHIPNSNIPESIDTGCIPRAEVRYSMDSPTYREIAENTPTIARGYDEDDPCNVQQSTEVHRGSSLEPTSPCTSASYVVSPVSSSCSRSYSLLSLTSLYASPGWSPGCDSSPCSSDSAGSSQAMGRHSQRFKRPRSPETRLMGSAATRSLPQTRKRVKKDPSDLSTLKIICLILRKLMSLQPQPRELYEGILIECLFTYCLQVSDSCQGARILLSTVVNYNFEIMLRQGIPLLLILIRYGYSIQHATNRGGSVLAQRALQRESEVLGQLDKIVRSDDGRIMLTRILQTGPIEERVACYLALPSVCR